MVNSGIVNRSRMLADSVLTSERLFVQTSAAINAEIKIRSRGTVILTGEPGAGKTTIAKHLCALSAAEGFEIVDIRKPEDAFKAWKKHKKQIFYFDDFLGSNYLALLSKDISLDIFRLVDSISKDQEKRFVLTTRSVILNGAKKSSDIFLYHNSEIYELEVSAGEIGIIDKARILYAHIYDRLSSPVQIGAFYNGGRYVDVVRHKNYNPRLIEYITTPERIKGSSSEEMWEEISNFLANPEYIWDRALNAQTHPYAKLLTELVSFYGQLISEENLEKAFNRFVHSNSSKLLGNYDHIDFREACRIAIGSLLRRVVHDKGHAYFSTINPSVRDYVYNRRKADSAFISQSLLALRSRESLKVFHQLEKQNLLPKNVVEEVFKLLILDIRNKSLPEMLESEGGFLLTIVEYGLESDLIGKSPQISQLHDLLLEEIDSDNLNLSCSVLNLMYEKKLFDPVKKRENLLAYLIACLDASSSFDTLDIVAALASFAEISEDEGFLEAFQASVEYYADDLLVDAKSDIVSELTHEEDIPKFRNKVYDYLFQGVTEFGIGIDTHFLGGLSESIDYEDEMIENTTNQGYSDDDEGYHSTSTYVSDDQIHDVFFREI